MKVEAKLRYCFILVMLLAGLSGILGIIIMIFSNVQYSNALVSNGFSQGEIGMFSTCLNKEPILIRELILISDETSLQSINNELTEAMVNTDAAYEKMKENCTTAEELNYLKEIDELLPQYRSVFERVRTLALDHQDDEALNILVEEGKPIFKELTTSVEDLINLNVELGNSVSALLDYITIGCIFIMVIVIVIAVVVSLKIASSVARLFAEPIIKVKDASALLAQGDLNIEVEKLYPDEIGEMTESFDEAANMLKTYICELERQLTEISQGNFNISSNVEFKGEFKAFEDAIEIITDTLSGMLGDIYDSSKQVAFGASQMAESAQTMAEGATDQAAAVEELTASIQTMTETAVYSSKEIANIITSIEDIASQTNLLSLNASIEAARAGETGRGFAVVADQIGKLAAGSAQSASETRNLIENAIREIENGNAIMQRTTQAISSVIIGIQTLAESTSEISSLSNSQADTMKQLEIGVEQISEVVQSNSSAAQETSAISEELSAQSTTLEELV